MARRVALLCSVLLVAAAFVLAVGVGRPARADQEFALTGDVAGLYPGAAMTIPVSVTNSQSFPIAMTSIAVTASDASSACPASMLTFGSLQAGPDVAPGATVTFAVPVRLDRAAPDSCQGVSWALEFSGTAGPASSGGGSGGGAIPPTGTDIVPMAMIALALVLAGGVTVERTRRRSP